MFSKKLTEMANKVQERKKKFASFFLTVSLVHYSRNCENSAPS